MSLELEISISKEISQSDFADRFKNVQLLLDSGRSRIYTAETDANKLGSYKDPNPSPVNRFETIVLKANDIYSLETKTIVEREFAIGKFLSTAMTQSKCHHYIVCVYEHFLVKKDENLVRGNENLVKGSGKIVPFEREKGNIPYGTHYIVMQYVKNSFGLDNLLPCVAERTFADPIADVKFLFIRLFETLKYIHKLDILHNNIRPGNIVFDEKNIRLSLLDFRYSCVIDSSKEIKRNWIYFHCTIRQDSLFLAPEVLTYAVNYKEDDIETCKKSDVFSLGSVLFALVNKCQTPYGIICNKDLTERDTEKLVANLKNNTLKRIESASGNSELDKFINAVTDFDRNSRPTSEFALEYLKKLTKK